MFDGKGGREIVDGFIARQCCFVITSEWTGDSGRTILFESEQSFNTMFTVFMGAFQQH